MKASRARHRAIIKSRQRPSAVGETVHFPMPALRYGAVLAAPADVPVSMAVVFGWLSRRLTPRAAYNVASSSIGWHGASASPYGSSAPGEQPDLLTQGRRPSAVETLLLLLPVAGAVGTELLPNRKKIDSTVALVMAAGGNAQRNR
jgi:hypothetical protein